MPPAVPIVAAGALAGASAALAGTTILGLTVLQSAIVIGVASAALNAVQTVLLAPSTPSQKRTTTLRQAITNQRLPFGEQVAAGVLTFFETTDDNRYHHMVIVLGNAPRAWHSIPIVWFDDEPIFESEINAGNNGEVTSGKYRPDASPDVWIRKHLGGPTDTPDAKLLNDVSYLDSNFAGHGIAYLVITFNWRAKLFPNGIPNIRVLARTNSVLDTRDSTFKFTGNSALVLRQFLLEPDVGGRFAATDMDDNQSNAAANICDEIVDVRPVGHAVRSVDAASNELRLAQASSGAPLRIETGDRVELFTDGTAPAGLATGTPYYAIVDRIVGANWKPSSGVTINLSAGSYTGAAATAITAGDVDAEHGSGIAAAIRLAASLENAIARTAIDVTGAGTGQHVIIRTGEPRYHASGGHDDGVEKGSAILGILSSMAGRLVWAGGDFLIKPGAYETPMPETFSEEDLFGPIDVETRHSRRTRFNAVRGIFSPLLTLGEETDYPPVVDSTFIANDGGDVLWRGPLDLPWTSRSSTAQRLAKIELSRHRREKRMQLQVGPKGFRAIPTSVVKVSNTRRGWADKTFEVIRMEDSEIDSDTGGPALRGVTLSLAETDSTVFDFDPDTEETVKPPAGSSSVGNPFVLSAPQGLAFASGDDELFIKSDGTVVSRIKVIWGDVDGFSSTMEIQYKQGATSVYQPAGVVDVDATLLYIWDVADGISYDIRARTVSSLGARSPWAEGTHTVTGKTTPPPNPSTFNISVQADGTRRFIWTATPPPDHAGYLIQYGVGTGVAWGAMQPLHTGLLTASPWETNELSAGTYTFGLVLVDTSGNESAAPAIIEATIGDPRLQDVIFSQNEFDLGWLGTKVDCFVAYEGVLEAAGLQTWDDLPATWDALPGTWRGIVTNKSPIEYTTLTIDLGSDFTFSPIVTANAVGTVTLTMQLGTTADGAPVGSFIPLGPMEGYRYIKFRASVAGTTPVLLSLVSLVDGEVKIEEYQDVDTSAASSGRFERIATGHFKLATRGETAAITSATIRAFQNAGSGWTWDLLSKATTITGDPEPAAEFKIYQNGTLTDATVDAEIKGRKK
jgi:hypothetical protein